MSRDLYESLFDRTEAEKMGEDAVWMSLLTEAAEGLRAWRAESLAAAEFEEGLWVEADPRSSADGTPLRLAAADEPERDWPVTYGAGPWSVLLSLDTTGQPYALLAGPGEVTLRIGAILLDIGPGEELPLPGLDAPPADITLVDEEGQHVVLRPVS
jgi:hypothetical protein